MTLDTQGFKDVLSRFASGVTVVTTMCDGVPHGLTVSAFSSVSLKPPRVLICLGNDTDSKPLIDRSGCFAVHILGRDHVSLGPLFAKLVPGVDDPFLNLSYRVEHTGSPILEQCLAWLDCRVENAVAIGDHTIYIGDVQSAGRTEADGEPVLYYRRAWRVLDPSSLG
ncbi:MAG TPA: flavin reductase family protein [Polyangiales bacterium]|nr:flavin reductase family protein [Polyangiales bacterium]